MVDPLRQSRWNADRSIKSINSNKELILSKGDRIKVPNSNVQYEIIGLIGKGQFGCVYYVKNLLNNFKYALKIINSSPGCLRSGISEVKILNEITEKGNKEGLLHIVGYHGHFVYQNHICIVLEKLSYSLLDVLKGRNYRGLPLHLIRVILSDLTKALTVFDELDLMHLDIKPENVLMESDKSVHVKLADIGSTEYVGETECKYSITRYYRPPEIVLGCGMSKKADIWSLGSLIAELFLGHVLFNAENENQLLTQIERILHTKIPKELIEKSPNASKFFDENGNLLPSGDINDSKNEIENSFEDIINNVSLPCGYSEEKLEKEIKMRKPFIDLLRNMLEPNPEKRFTLNDVINHPFLTDLV